MENLQLKKQQSGKLLFFGVFLFLLGLVAGFAIPKMANPRMGLSSHLEGVMNGMFLIVLGLIWDRLELSAKWLTTAFWLSLYGTFVNWLAVLVAAITLSGKMMPIAGGQEGSSFPEGFVTFGLISLSIAMVGVCLILMSGLYKQMNLKQDS